jgi:hypothetical protein
MFYLQPQCYEGAPIFEKGNNAIITLLDSATISAFHERYIFPAVSKFNKGLRLFSLYSALWQLTDLRSKHISGITASFPHTVVSTFSVRMR